MSDEKEVEGTEVGEKKLSKEERKAAKAAKKAAKRAAREAKGEASGEKTKMEVKSSKAKPEYPIVPTTGTRFDGDTARQLAFDIVFENAKAGKSTKDIRAILANTNKKNGAKFSLDAGYINFVVASHPDFFEMYSDGSIVVLKEPVVDSSAAEKYEQEKVDRKKKAEENRKKRKDSKKEEGEGENKKAE